MKYIRYRFTENEQTENVNIHLGLKADYCRFNTVSADCCTATDGQLRSHFGLNSHRPSLLRSMVSRVRQTVWLCTAAIRKEWLSFSRPTLCFVKFSLCLFLSIRKCGCRLKSEGCHYQCLSNVLIEKSACLLIIIQKITEKWVASSSIEDDVLFSRTGELFHKPKIGFNLV